LAARYLLVLGVIVGGGALWTGLDYYLVPLPERPFSPLHAQFAPTGLVGQGLGIIGTLMIAVGVVAYGARKRLRVLARLGKLRSWLRFHIFLCLVGPFLVLLHTSFKFGGLVAIAFWSMTAVVASGAFGRWVYVWIPKTANGRFFGRDEIRRRLRDLLRDLEGQLGMTPDELLELLDPRRRALELAASADGGRLDRQSLSYAGPDRRRGARRKVGVLSAIGDSVSFAFQRRRERARFRRVLAASGVSEPARSRVIRNLEEERRLELQLRLLEPFQAAFRYWHAFHLPLAVVMVVVLIVHVAVAIAFGYTWIWRL
jgi:hypothetical protein